MKTVIEMAREADAGFIPRYDMWQMDTETLERFAALVREDERKEQALQRLSDIHQEMEHKPHCASLTQMLLSMPPQPAPCNCGADIRARSKE